jgi:hypothetical protein
MLQRSLNAVHKLHVNYMVWAHLPAPTVPGAYECLNALPVIAANLDFN